MENNSFKIALAQLNSTAKDFTQNTKKHLYFIKKAGEKNANLIIFPELSLSSYRRDFTEDEILNGEGNFRFDQLERGSRENNIVVVYGAPVLKNSKVHIASIVQYPDGKRNIYFKNNLYEGEDILFSCGAEPVTIEIGTEKIFLGICYDIEIEDHVAAAAKSGATIYGSSIFYSPNGIEGLIEKAKMYSEKYKMDFAISNFSGHMWDGISGGKTMYFTSEGKCAAICNDSEEAILYCTKESASWKGEVEEVKYRSHFCTCTDCTCKLNPVNHDKGCDFCVKKCLHEGEIPSCFFKDIYEDISGVKDFTYKGFVEFVNKHMK